MSHTDGEQRNFPGRLTKVLERLLVLVLGILLVLVTQFLVLVNVVIITVLSVTRKSTELDEESTPRIINLSKTMLQLNMI